MPKAVLAVAAEHVRTAATPQAIGIDGRIRISSFVDLLSAAHIEDHLTILAKHFAARLKDDLQLQDKLIAIPKRGNCLLGQAIAKSLGLKTLFVRRNVLFGRFIEGRAHNGAQAVLVDDVSSDGDLLREAVENLHAEGIHVAAARVLIERAEGDAQEKLEGLGINYLPYYVATDQELGRMAD